MGPIEKCFFFLKTNTPFAINLYFYTLWKKKQHVNRKSLYNVAIQSYIFIYISSKKRYKL